MKVKKIQVKNLRQIESIETSFDWCTAIITGGNNTGKSTLLKSIIDRLRGDKSSIIKEWKQSWEAKRTFTDGSILEWDLLGNADKITYTTKEWIKTSAIKTICETLFWKWFDIDVFLNAQPKDKKKIMQELVWIDFTELDIEYEKAYNDRTEKNAIYRTEKAKLSDMQEQPTQWLLIDISELQEKLIEAEKNNEQIISVKEKIEYKNNRIKAIDIQIQQLEEEKKTVESEILKWNERLQGKKNIDTTWIRDEIELQKSENKIHESNNIFYSQITIVEKAKWIADEADEIVKSIENKKLEIIKSANMPKWFEFADDWLLFNWYKLDKSHLSSSQTYIAWLMLASMNMWEVKMLTFDASYLDKNSLEEIEKRADEQDLQLLIERPDYEWWEIRYEIIESK